MGYKLAPDWYWLENANLSGKEEYFLSLEIAKDESEKYRKEALANGNEYKENIFPDVRCLPPGKYFIGDESDNIFGGVYIFKDEESLEKYKKGPIFEFLSTNEYFDNFTTKEHGVIDGPSIIAGAKTDTII